MSGTSIINMMTEDKESHSNTVEFLISIGKLKHLKRTGWVKRHIKNCETVAGHMYRMGIMACLLDDEILDRNRCIKMALIHDIPECIVGDITPFCGVTKEEKHRQEMKAMNELCSLLGEKIRKELLSLYMEYEEQKTVEAKSVKDLDKFDMLFQAFEYELMAGFDLNLQEFFDNTEGMQNKTVLKWFEELQCIRSKNLDGTLSSEPKSLDLNVLEFFAVMGKLKHLRINRKCLCQTERCDCVTFADHIYRTSIMAFLLDDGTSSGLNRDKCIKMALIQNMALPGRYKQDDVKMIIMQRIFGSMDEKVKNELLDLYKEYKAQQSPEAKLVKDLFEFEPSLETYENNTKGPHCPGSEDSGVSGLAEKLQLLGKET